MIDQIFNFLPELYREIKAHVSRFRLLIGFVIVSAVSFAISQTSMNSFSMGTDPSRAAGSFLQITGIVQLFVLAFMTMLNSVRTISDERTQKTWDFQRLTPLGPWRLTLGKILASLIYPTFLFLCFFPGQLMVLTSYPEHLPQFFFFIVQAFCAGLAASGIGLLASAHSEKTQRGSFFLAFMAINMVVPALVLRNETNHQNIPIQLLGFEISKVQWMTLTTFLAGFWGVLGARWRIGKDLLESPKFWRGPAFIIFVYFYWANTSFQNFQGEFSRTFASRLLPVGYAIPILVYFMALFQPVSRERIRQLLNPSLPLGQRLNLVPPYLYGALSIILSVSVLHLVWGGGIETTGQQFAQYAFLVPLFMLRDVLIFQWLTWLRVRNAYWLAFVITALSYVVPAILLQAFTSGWEKDSSAALYPIFLPLIPENHGIFISFLPVVIQLVFLVLLCVQQFVAVRPARPAKEI
jgi:hypothetical protein